MVLNSIFQSSINLNNAIYSNCFWSICNIKLSSLTLFVMLCSAFISQDSFISSWENSQQVESSLTLLSVRERMYCVMSSFKLSQMSTWSSSALTLLTPLKEYSSPAVLRLSGAGRGEKKTLHYEYSFIIPINPSDLYCRIQGMQVLAAMLQTM